MSDLSLFMCMNPQRLLTMSEVWKFDGSKREKTNGSKRENLTVLSEAPPGEMFIRAADLYTSPYTYSIYYVSVFVWIFIVHLHNIPALFHWQLQECEAPCNTGMWTMACTPFGKTKAITSDVWGHNFHRSPGFDHAWACPGSVPHVYFRFLLTSSVG